MNINRTRIFEVIVNSLLPQICNECHIAYVSSNQIICIDCVTKLETIACRDLTTFNARNLHKKLGMPERYFYFKVFGYCMLYEQVVRTMYHAVKFQERRNGSKLMINMLVKKISPLVKTDDCLIPVPSSSATVKKVCKLVAKEKQATVLDIFEKKKLASVKKSAKINRFEIVRKSIVVKKDFKKRVNADSKEEEHLINPDRNYFVIDDVWSTGSTMNQICYHLHSLGFNKKFITALVFFYNPSKSQGSPKSISDCDDAIDL